MQYFLSKKCSHLFASTPFASRLSPFAFVGYSAQKTVYHSEVLK